MSPKTVPKFNSLGQANILTDNKQYINLINFQKGNFIKKKSNQKMSGKRQFP